MRVCVCVCVCARARACACVRARASRCVHVRESACVRLPAEEDRRRFDTGARVGAGKAALGQPWLSMIGLSCAPSLQETSQGGPGGGVSCLLDSSTGIRMKRCMPLKFYILDSLRLASWPPAGFWSPNGRVRGFFVFSPFGQFFALSRSVKIGGQEIDWLPLAPSPHLMRGSVKALCRLFFS